jgi:hypothetical protein
MRSVRVIKRETAISNIRTLVRQEIVANQPKSVVNSRSNAPGGLGSAFVTTPGTGTGGTSPIQAHAYNVTGTPTVLTVVTRNAVKPRGAVYFWDDESNDLVELRYDSLNDPMTFLF